MRDSVSIGDFCVLRETFWVLKKKKEVISMYGTNDHKPSIKECVACNDFWPWPIFLRSFNHDFAIKTAKIWHILSSSYCNIYSSGWIIFICGTNDASMRGCVVHNDFWPWLQGHSAMTAIKLLKIRHILWCFLYNMCYSGWILFILNTNDR